MKKGHIFCGAEKLLWSGFWKLAQCDSSSTSLNCFFSPESRPVGEFFESGLSHSCGMFSDQKTDFVFEATEKMFE